MSYLDVVKHPVVGLLLGTGIDLILTYEAILVPGFYKSDYISLSMNQDGHLYAHSRYGEGTRIRTLDDLIELNLQWWRYSKDRSRAWSVPSEPWASLAVNRGLLTKTVKEIVEYK